VGGHQPGAAHRDADQELDERDATQELAGVAQREGRNNGAAGDDPGGHPSTGPDVAAVQTEHDDAHGRCDHDGSGHGRQLASGHAARPEVVVANPRQ
jgi:hypothetical protein